MKGASNLLSNKFISDRSKWAIKRYIDVVDSYARNFE